MQNKSHRLWEVVGGTKQGGILVRSSWQLDSLILPQRLENGAHVYELEFVDGRLHYHRLHGNGPDTGWVSTKFKGRDLLIPVPNASTLQLAIGANNMAIPDSSTKLFVEEGWAHFTQVGVPKNLLSGVYDDIKEMEKHMTPGSITTYDDNHASELVRNDHMVWMTRYARQCCPSLAFLDQILEEFAHHFAKQMKSSHPKLRISGREPAMLAKYEPHGFFRPHTDAAKAGNKFEDSRILTLVYYLNPMWCTSEGGALKLHPLGRPSVDIWPQEDTLVMFRADELLHEVCEGTRMRSALTIFFRGDCN